ncbi:MAG: hypothetical protein Q8L41_08210 [Anaerolineales bacterium]|nr:hypothetical protein [Anaerolineales bacterium]
MEWIQPTITILSLVGGILAWVAKIRWSKEYSVAKDETIKAKEAQMQAIERELQIYKELTPMKIKEYYLSSKELYEVKIDGLENKLKTAQEEIQDLQKGEEKEKIKSEIDAFTTQLQFIKHQQEFALKKQIQLKIEEAEYLYKNTMEELEFERSSQVEEATRKRDALGIVKTNRNYQKKADFAKNKMIRETEYLNKQLESSEETTN